MERFVGPDAGETRDPAGGVPVSAEERLPVGAYVASALMAANIPCDSGEDVDRFLNELESRGYAVVPLSVALAAEKASDTLLSDSYVCPACGGGWWTVGDDSYACNHAAGVSVPTEPGAPDLTFRPDYGPVERLADARPAPDHPIWSLDVATLDYVIESLVGIWSVEPDLLIDSAIADVRVIRGYAASRPVPAPEPSARLREALEGPTHLVGCPRCAHCACAALAATPQDPEA